MKKFITVVVLAGLLIATGKGLYKVGKFAGKGVVKIVHVIV